MVTTSIQEVLKHGNLSASRLFRFSTHKKTYFRYFIKSFSLFKLKGFKRVWVFCKANQNLCLKHVIIHSQSVLVLVPDTIEKNLFPHHRSFLKMMFSLSPVCSSMGIKDISRMICHVKFILAWILLLPRLSGNVFYCDFVLFCVYFLLSSLN